MNYIKTIQEKISKLGLNKKDAAYFVYNYGKQTDVILTKFDELTDVDMEQRMIKAEVWFSILYESACSPVDFLRSPIKMVSEGFVMVISPELYHCQLWF